MLNKVSKKGRVGSFLISIIIIAVFAIVLYNINTNQNSSFEVITGRVVQTCNVKPINLRTAARFIEASDNVPPGKKIIENLDPEKNVDDFYSKYKSRNVVGYLDVDLSQPGVVSEAGEWSTSARTSAGDKMSRDYLTYLEDSYGADYSSIKNVKSQKELDGLNARIKANELAKDPPNIINYDVFVYNSKTGNVEIKPPQEIKNMYGTPDINYVIPKDISSTAYSNTQAIIRKEVDQIGYGSPSTRVTDPSKQIVKIQFGGTKPWSELTAEEKAANRQNVIAALNDLEKNGIYISGIDNNIRVDPSTGRVFIDDNSIAFSAKQAAPDYRAARENVMTSGGTAYRSNPDETQTLVSTTIKTKKNPPSVYVVTYKNIDNPAEGIILTDSRGKTYIRTGAQAQELATSAGLGQTTFYDPFAGEVYLPEQIVELDDEIIEEVIELTQAVE